jgi:molybdopterin-guanine dinucleotide biosynthesis protein A
VNGNIEPLVAFYPKSARTLAEALLRDGRNAAAFFAGCCVQSGVARLVELSAKEAKFFSNRNSPADFKAASTKGKSWA